jgi:FAD:protein FMN transferase
MPSTKTVPDQPLQRDLRVMASQAHIVVHGGTVEMLDTAERRLHELESLWSRFRDDSDVTRANQAGGYPVVVHEDTLAVVSRAIQAWQQTDGLFDITTLPALLDHGYTHSVISRQPAPPVGGTQSGQCGWIEVDYEASTLRVPGTTAIDLGGIGKGFAADIVAESIIEAGADGALVNVGGDLVVLGTPSDDASWYLGIEDPRQPPEHVAVLRLLSGGVATSGTTIRRWTSPFGEPAHHLIDPRRHHPSGSGLLSATVIAADAATAEAFATAAMMLAAPDAVNLLDRIGLAGLVVAASGEVVCSRSLADFAPSDPSWARFEPPQAYFRAHAARMGAK